LADAKAGRQEPDSEGGGDVEWEGQGPTRRKPGKKALAAAAEMSQLLDGYLPPRSSALLLDK